MKTTFFHGITAGVLAGLAASVYNYAYSAALLVDFSAVINPVAIFGSSIFGCLLASLGYHFFSKWVRANTDVWFNILFLGLTFASFAGSFAANLPSTVETPELFAGLSVPMHLFPVVFWLAIKPLRNITQ
jgi:predicted membrane channel-forming protein YqfA (hemolysin III family)